MHSNDFYDRDDDDSILKIITPLRKNTEIEELDDNEYNEFAERTRDQISFHSRKLSERKIIEIIDGRFKKNPTFAKMWKNRQTYWDSAETTPEITASSKALDVYDIENLSDSESLVRSSASKHPQTMETRSLGVATFTTSVTEVGQNVLCNIIGTC